MRIEYYNSKIERKSITDNAHSLGETVIHDDFLDKNGKVTDGNSGKLSLDKIPNVVDPNFVRRKELIQKIKDGTITSIEVKEWLKLNL